MANVLRNYRETNQLSQQEVADKLDISRAMVGLLENGERNFTVEMAIAMEVKLGIPREKVRPDFFRKAAA